jgi:hypothetical protein
VRCQCFEGVHTHGCQCPALSRRDNLRLRAARATQMRKGSPSHTHRLAPSAGHPASTAETRCTSDFRSVEPGSG